MTTATTSTPDGLAERRGALAERLFTASVGTLELGSIYIGDRLGLYRSLASEGTATTAELAARTGAAERYVREWLEQQAVAGLLSVDDAAAPAAERRYSLPDEHRAVLVEEQELTFSAPLARLVVGALAPIERLLEAFRTGGGVPYEAYGENLRDGIAAVNRPVFTHQLAGWLAAIPEIDERLRAEPSARVADIACGMAWSSIAIARAYPAVHVDAFDLDAASIVRAQENVAAAGLADRVRPQIRDAADPELEGRYDLVTIFEALHDMNHPVSALRTARRLLSEGGCVLVADERVPERFAAPDDERERSHYGWSVLHCLAVGMNYPDSAGTGAVMRPDTVRAYATEAGFGRVDVLAIEHDFWRFYRLMP